MQGKVVCAILVDAVWNGCIKGQAARDFKPGTNRMTTFVMVPAPIELRQQFGRGACHGELAEPSFDRLWMTVGIL